MAQKSCRDTVVEDLLNVPGAALAVGCVSDDDSQATCGSMASIGAGAESRIQVIRVARLFPFSSDIRGLRQGPVTDDHESGLRTIRRF